MIRTLLARGTVLVACSVLVSTGIASAAWTKAGTGAGAGSSTSLAAPTGVSAATVAPTSSAIDVTFSPATNPTGTTYTVTRDKTKSGAAGPQVACSGLTASPCHDTGLSSGITFTYTLTAVLGTNWLRAAETTPSATTTASFAITTRTFSNGSRKYSFSGTGAPATAQVTVTVCTVDVWPCAAANQASPVVTVTPPAPGPWGPTGSTGNLNVGTTYFARASQGAASTATFTFTPANGD
jgi:hypothetical protein